MKSILYIACVLVFLLPLCTFGQQVSETNFSLGISKTSAPDHERHWDEDPPIYLLLNASKSWYNNHWLSLQKEAGLNLQYAHIDLSGGGLAAGNHYSGHIISLFAHAALQARLRISQTLAFGLGPEAEILLMGQNNLNNSYYTLFTNPPSSGDIHEGGFNRDYFNKPSYGIKFSLFETAINAKTTIGIHVSYLWTKSEYSNFYASNYTRISFCLGFISQKKELPADPPN
jgi:hypothetical protein